MTRPHRYDSQERATCSECGVEGWRGGWPGEGGIVPLGPRLYRDDCDPEA